MAQRNSSTATGPLPVILISILLGIGIFLDSSGCLALIGLGAVVGFLIGVAAVAFVRPRQGGMPRKQDPAGQVMSRGYLEK